MSRWWFNNSEDWNDRLNSEAADFLSLNVIHLTKHLKDSMPSLQWALTQIYNMLCLGLVCPESFTIIYIAEKILRFVFSLGTTMNFEQIQTIKYYGKINQNVQSSSREWRKDVKWPKSNYDAHSSHLQEYLDARVL